MNDGAASTMRSRPFACVDELQIAFDLAHEIARARVLREVLQAIEHERPGAVAIADAVMAPRRHEHRIARLDLFDGRALAEPDLPRSGADDIEVPKGVAMPRRRFSGFQDLLTATCVF